jgi:hypothetical protein
MTTATETEAKITPAMMTKVVFVRDHAIHHAEAGWSVVIECCSDERIAAAIGRARTVTGAVNEVRKEIVAPWVMQLIETREGSDNDWQLAQGRRLHDELTENWWDATARLENRSNADHKPPRKEIEALGLRVPASSDEVEIDLTDAEIASAALEEAAREAAAEAKRSSGRQAPSGRTTDPDAAPSKVPAPRKPRARKAASTTVTSETPAKRTRRPASK